MIRVLVLLLCISFFYSANAQVLTKPNWYGLELARGQINTWLRIPSDTTANKEGIARIGTTIYAGNGTYWTAASGGGGSTTLQEAIDNSPLLDKDNAIDGGGNNLTFNNSPVFNITSTDSIVINNSNSEGIIIGDVYNAAGGATLQVNKSIDSIIAKALEFKIANSSGVGMLSVSDATSSTTISTDKVYFDKYPDTLTSNFSQIGRDITTGKIGVIAGGGGASYWTTTGSDIYYNTGSVGIGNTSPQSKLDITTNGIGTTQTNTSGLLLADTTAAASGLPQYSPALRFRGTAWKSSATAASQTIDYRQYLSTIGASAAGTGNLLFDYSINGGSYATTAVIGQRGVISSIGLVSNTSGFYLANSGFNVNSPTSSSAGGLVYQSLSIVSLYAANLYTLQLYADNQRFDNFTGEVMRINSSSNLLIGTTTNVSCAKVVINSTTQGLLLPRMSTSQKNAITSPVEGLLLYDNVLHQVSYWNGSAYVNL